MATSLPATCEEGALERGRPGERLFTLREFAELAELQAVATIQPDLSHCGGLTGGRKIAGIAEAGQGSSGQAYRRHEARKRTLHPWRAHLRRGPVFRTP